ncbi:kunitz-type U19-barytoxin-Tl1a [Scyliorhinus canicula]|uniref:kunitz-type U19-barytoxin-Tl1a n=1 Tax=Scyliorhinus canicula TaxID=7830 RepID=UPI0018F5E850|nr:kunitz-type U19-barytoxin-Tl1a [Scyliorhinus canicula]
MWRIALYLGICISTFNLCVTANRSEACMEPMLSGEQTDPKSRSIQWFFASTADYCQPFVYTGIGGNKNRFQNETYCLKTCSDNYSQKFPEGDAACQLQKERGDCRANILKWYYDETTKSCETFLFSGCHGNGNQFEDKKSCRSLCAASGQGRFNVNEEETEIQQRDEGDTVAIVFGCLFGIAVIGFVAVFVIQRKKHKSQRSKSKATTEVEMQ